MTLPPKRWFRIGEVAALLGLHPNTVRRWVDLGVVRARRDPSGERRISREALAAILVWTGK